MNHRIQRIWRGIQAPSRLPLGDMVVAGVVLIMVDPWISHVAHTVLGSGLAHTSHVSTASRTTLLTPSGNPSIPTSSVRVAVNPVSSAHRVTVGGWVQAGILAIMTGGITGILLSIVHHTLGAKTRVSSSTPEVVSQPQPQPQLSAPSHGKGESYYQEIPAGAMPIRMLDIAGNEEAKKEVVELIDFLKNPEKYERLGARIPRGVLLHGDPGNGKTLLAKAVAGEANTRFFFASGSDFVEKYVGVGAKRVRELFQAVRKQVTPAIVFIDEIDALGRSRGQGHPEADQTLNQLLTELDGFKTVLHHAPIIVMAATNRIDVLDSALLRPGRFDRHIAITFPDLQSRQRILEIHTRNKPLGGDVDLAVIASRTPGFSGADLENLCNEAAIHAARFDQTLLTDEDFLFASDRVVAGLESHRRLTEPDLQRVSIHESGHAILGWIGKTHRIHKITIVPHGASALGYVFRTPHDDRLIATVDDLWNQVIGMLGGRAAELVMFGTASTGASDDFQKATSVVSDMIQRYGMTDWGLATVADASADVNETISRVLDHGMELAYTTITQHKADLMAMAAELRVKETVVWEDIQRVWGHVDQPGFPLTFPVNRWTRMPQELLPAQDAGIADTAPVAL